MTEEPSKQEAPAIEKLLVDDPNNFPFHTAYMVYSELFDGTADLEVKKDLNKNIEDLNQNRIDYESYYRNIAHYRKVAPIQRADRAMFQTQRKKDWRVKEQRQDRIKRHKK
jgi:hypothetical protein